MTPLIAPIAAILLLFCSNFSAYASPEVRKAASLLTTSEATLATIALLGQHFKTRIEDLSWSVEFTERTWVARLSGNINRQKSEFTITGYVWGNDQETLSVNYAGFGEAGGEPLLINGTATWLYNTDAKDYQAMDFRQVTKIGKNSFWGWVLGAEIVVGGGVGGVVAVSGASVATGGLALGMAPWIAAGGAAGGAATLVTISDGAKSLLASDTAPSPPAMPKRPNPPKNGEKLSPHEGEMLIVLFDKDSISGSAVDGVHLLEGNYSFKEGSAKGLIRAVKK